MDRLKRKAEAKQRKRELIEASGGKRPRNNTTVSNKVQDEESNNSQKSKNDDRAIGNKNKYQQRGKKSFQRKDKASFGSVMEECPNPNQPRKSTLSIAIPGSVVSNAQTHELRTQLVGQIARASAIYHVDEIIVYDDQLAKELKPYYRNNYHGRGQRNQENEHRKEDDTDENRGGSKDNSKSYPPKTGGSTDPHEFMARVLQFCECPQYLRRHFFPMHPDLQFAGLLPPLDAPHHVRVGDRSTFREGVVLDKKGQNGSLVNCGIRNQPVEIDRTLSPGIRCTVEIEPKAYGTPGKRIQGTVVSPSKPRETDGTYWGYTTRLASSIQAVFDESPYESYDLKIGTSERGDLSIDSFMMNMHRPMKNMSKKQKQTCFPKAFNHALIVFGGVAGIEECVDADENLRLAGKDSKVLFDMWINVCPYQGSRTIRSEEAVLITLARLRPYLFPILNDDDQNFRDIAGEDTVSSIPEVKFSDEEPSDESESE